MKLYSWNVNGLRAAAAKGYRQWLAACDADAVLLQEIKAEPAQLDPQDREPEGFACVLWNPSKGKKGYSGTATLLRKPPTAHAFGLPDPAFQGEGRCVHTEHQDFHLLNVYFPNGQMSQERLDFKLAFYDAFLAYAQELRKTKPVVAAGDFNTAHKPVDLARPKQNETVSGFLPVERAWLDKFLAHGYVDVLRRQRPEGPNGQGAGLYTWWSFRSGARERNVGWRIDYFFVSEEMADKVARAWIEPEVQGSDHCPVGLELDVR